MKYVIQLIGVVTWIAGVVIANGFWSTFFAIFCPLWGWYLVIERLLIMNGIL